MNGVDSLASRPRDTASRSTARRHIVVFPDRESWIKGAAEFIAARAADAVAERGRFTLALSGGNTPRPIYDRLGSANMATRIDWSKVWLFFGDERCVPPDDRNSNYHLARTTLLGRVPIPPKTCIASIPRIPRNRLQPPMRKLSSSVSTATRMPAARRRSVST